MITRIVNPRFKTPTLSIMKLSKQTTPTKTPISNTANIEARKIVCNLFMTAVF